LDDVFAFLHEAESLKKIESYKQLTEVALAPGAEFPENIKLQIRILAYMGQQTTECAYFIRDYAKDKTFCMPVFVHVGRSVSRLSSWSGLRMAKNLSSEADSKITQYEDKFNEFKSAFQGHAILQTEMTVLQTKFTVLRIMDSVDDIGECFFDMLCLFSISPVI
jgi:hypothetical protein